MLRGTTLGWALEAGFNRVWIAGWRLWLPVLLIVDSVLWHTLSSVVLWPWDFPMRITGGMWPGAPDPPDSWLQVFSTTMPEMSLPVGHLATPSLGATLVGLFVLAGWLVERRTPRSTVRRFFTRSPLVPFLGLLSAALGIGFAYRIGGDFELVSGVNTRWFYQAGLAVNLATAGAVGALTIWLPLGRSRSTMLGVVVATGAVMTACAGRAAIVSQLVQSGDPELAEHAVLGMSAAYWVAFPVAAGAALGGLGIMALLRAARPIGVIVLLGFGWHVALAVPALAVPDAIGWNFGEPPGENLRMTIWVLPALLRFLIEAVAIIGSFWLLASIAALGEAGEHAAPVDAAPAQQ